MLFAFVTNRALFRAFRIGAKTLPRYLNSLPQRPITFAIKHNPKFSAKLNFSSTLRKCGFHTSPRRFNPIITTIIRQGAKVATMVVGRAFRNWWKNLPQNKRAAFGAWLARHKWKFILAILSLIVCLAAYYYTHLQEAPLTRRKRFIAFTPNQFEQLNKLEMESQLQQYKDKLLPSSNSATQRVAKVAKQLLDRNRDIEHIKTHDWSVSVIDEEQTMNAFVLPTGNIFVFSGLLKICDNDDQLGIVLSHEISHAILGHGMEMISHAHIVDIIFIGLLGFLWMFLPTDVIASTSTAISRFIMNIVMEAPYSRMLETEADVVGLELAAKACFDIREASAFWNKMSIIEKSGGQQMNMNLEFLATHPSHEKRGENLDSLLDKAIQNRASCGCPALPKIDPRERVKLQKNKIVEDIEAKKYEGVLKIGDLKH